VYDFKYTAEQVDVIMKNYLSYELIALQDTYIESFYTSLFNRRLREFRYMMNFCTIPLAISVPGILENALLDDVELNSVLCNSGYIDNRWGTLLNKHSYEVPLSNRNVCMYKLFVMKDICTILNVRPMIIPASLLYRILCYKIDNTYLKTGRHTVDAILTHMDNPKIKANIMEMNGSRFAYIEDMIDEMRTAGII
jgi:hypothetical protein